ncbi:Riboflavin biosynthesis protein RibBA [Hartmannibacter diazotrophicus]|uniref:3,4-dihydroxy-2-butanone 4-phosphate synthase n=1 Tax=Hartmannibacter diazotrophicus TaxID=1482074 RepID=A0A2C9CZV8_9HYPH|nr:3,4-dihydroxy-2-butanone-4-phosphate synthase [Hartmannibacter diazotrophicus]SON53622.1 Riboflavin biosynthesis protein RibBA [Hartmannibacter diazotrophicus]
MKLDKIEAAIAAIANGELVIVVDDTDRENEGDLIMAASKATPETMAFMIRHTSGIICVPMTGERADTLNLPPMVANNLDPMRTAFTISVDYKVGMTTGISSEERANTARALANDNAQASDFLRPGHIFPLIARAGGVLTRSGHTEAGVDLARLAGIEPVGILAEVVNDDGTVKRLPELLAFAAEHKLKIISIEDLIAYRIRTERFVSRAAAQPMTIGGMKAMVYAYQTPFDPLQHIVAVFGEIGNGEDIFTRIHREQPVLDLFCRSAQKGFWLDGALEAIRSQGDGRGVLMFLRTPHADDLAEMSTTGATDTPDEGPKDGEGHSSAIKRMNRWREVGVGAQILRDLGVVSIAVLASQNRQYVGLGGFGIEISRTIRLEDQA